MLKFLMIVILGAFIGGLMGYFGKCTDGKCPLTANPWRGALFGMVLGGIAGLPVLQQVHEKVADSKNIIRIESVEDFDKLLQSEKPLVVDFYADWCGPCRRLTPVMNQLATDMTDKVDVVKINIDKFDKLAKKYAVSSIPCIIYFKNGKEEKRLIGMKKYQDYADLVD
ncbi:MAG: thioredoxin [Verrucomicrobiota bacterium]|nr:thioredoxin [Verrucomicrobiota bacterium]